MLLVALLGFIFASSNRVHGAGHFALSSAIGAVKSGLVDSRLLPLSRLANTPEMLAAKYGAAQEFFLLFAGKDGSGRRRRRRGEGRLRPGQRARGRQQQYDTERFPHNVHFHPRPRSCFPTPIVIGDNAATLSIGKEKQGVMRES